MATGTATLSFGATGDYSTSVSVSDATVGAGTKVEAYLIVPASDAPRYRDEYWVEDLRVYAGNISAGVGFTIYGACRLQKALGDYVVNYVTL